MKIDWSKPLRTVQGHYPVRVLCTDRKHLYPVVILYSISSDERIYSLTIDGKCDCNASSPFVENVPEDQYVWINVYKREGHDLYSGTARSSKEGVDNNISPHGVTRVSRIKIKLEEGRWDE